LENAVRGAFRFRRVRVVRDENAPRLRRRAFRSDHRAQQETGNQMEGSEVRFEDLTGLTLKEICGGLMTARLTFITTDDREFVMVHSQDCCEHVSIEDIAGDLQDLIGSPILLAEEVVSNEPDVEERARRERLRAEGEHYWEPDSETWTFYKIATIKGSVTIRWYGTSNGYYSESVSFVEAGTDEAEWVLR
jgi:hypothetical protein